MKIKEARALPTEEGAKRKTRTASSRSPMPLYVVVDGAGGTEAQEAALEIMRSHTRALYKKVRSVADTHSSENRLPWSFFRGRVQRGPSKAPVMEDELITQTSLPR